MSNTNSEKINKSESVLKEAVLEYEEILKVAKNLVVENNSKELNGLVEKFLKESENKESVKTKNQEPAKGKKIQESTMVQKPIGEVKEEVAVVAPATVNMKEPSLAEVEAAFDNANHNDDFQVVQGGGQPETGGVSPEGSGNGSGESFDLTSIEGEIDEMMKEINKAEEMQNVQQPAAAAPTAAAPQQQSNPVDRFKQIHEEMGKYLKEIDEMNANQHMMDEFHHKMSEMYGENYKTQLDEARIAELFNMYKQVQSGNAGKPTNDFQADAKTQAAPQGAVAEVAAPVEENKVDEVHGVSLSNNKLAGAEVQPRLDMGKEYAEHRVRLALQKESIDKKLSALLKENLALTKKFNKANTELNESKKASKTLLTLNENFKGALEKYRVQLKEMAVLNTNISYVNNLLVNEGIALTTKDKQEIIGKFKKVGSVNESEQIYKTILKEYTETKKTITESLEDKVTSTIVEPSSKNVIEESMNSGDEHVNKMLRLSGLSEKKKVM
jgi:hypothetical protein